MFETCVALGVLELVLQSYTEARWTLNSQRSTCLSLQGAGLKVCATTQILFLLLLLFVLKAGFHCVALAVQELAM